MRIINFVGFLPFKSSAFEISENNSEIDLGEIRLHEDIDVLEELVIQGEKSSMELSLDKKIFNVGEILRIVEGRRLMS